MEVDWAGKIPRQRDIILWYGIHDWPAESCPLLSKCRLSLLELIEPVVSFITGRRKGTGVKPWDLMAGANRKF
jgi:hypothetical protein